MSASIMKVNAPTKLIFRPVTLTPLEQNTECDDWRALETERKQEVFRGESKQSSSLKHSAAKTPVVKSTTTFWKPGKVPQKNPGCQRAKRRLRKETVREGRRPVTVKTHSSRWLTLEMCFVVKLFQICQPLVLGANSFQSLLSPSLPLPIYVLRGICIYTNIHYIYIHQYTQYINRYRYRYISYSLCLFLYSLCWCLMRWLGKVNVPGSFNKEEAVQAFRPRRRQLQSHVLNQTGQ